MSYTTPELVQQEIRAESPFSESTYPDLDTLNTWISQAESEINTRTGNLYEQATVSDEIYDWENVDNILRVDGLISSVTLEYNDQPAGETPSWTTKTEDTDFYVYGDEGEIEFIPSKFKPLQGKRRFRLSYTKGSEDVPGVVQRLATLLVSQRVVQTVIQEQAYSNSGGDIQVGIIKIGTPSSFSTDSFKETKNEIENLYNKVIGQHKFTRISRVY